MKACVDVVDVKELHKGKDVIFYGADAYAHENYEHWIQMGWNPVCFCDEDEQEQGGEFLDTGLSILPLLEAIDKYPNYLIVLTVNPERAIEGLTFLTEKKGVDHNRIRTVNNYEYRMGCDQMNNILRIAPRIAPCCHPEAKLITVYPSGDWDEDFRQYEKLINERISEFRNPSSTNEACLGCLSLKEGFYPTEVEFKTLAFAGKINGERCNCRCIYCDLTKSGEQVRKGEYSLSECLAAVVKRFPEIKILDYAPAEITVSPYKKEIYSLLRDKGWKTKVFLTSGVWFDIELAEILKTHSRLGLNCSLDAGTRETYKKIKGVDCFDKTVDNLKRYKDYGRVTLKYIILDGYNDTHSELDSFFDIACEITDFVILAQDYAYMKNGDMPQTRLDLFEHAVATAAKYNITCGIHQMGFTKNDVTNLKGFKKKYGA